MVDTHTTGVGGSPLTGKVKGLPLSYTPICAAYAPGPFIDAGIVTPSEIRWMNARTYVVRDQTTGHEYRALRVLDHTREVVGYWAVEPLPEPLDFGDTFDQERQDALGEYKSRQEQTERDRKRRRLRGPDVD